MVLPTARHRFTRLDLLRPLDVSLGRPIRTSAHVVTTRSALDIPRVRAVADRLEREFRLVMDG